jgi:inorganic triphosphatase YgiF
MLPPMSAHKLAQLILQFSATPVRLSAIQRKMRSLAGEATPTTSSTHIFFDTPKRTLQQRGLGLHLERDGGLWVQHLARTVADTGTLGSLVERKPYAGAFSLTGLATSAAIKPKALRKLARIFEIRQRHTGWALTAPSGARIDCVFDRGWILAGEAKAPFAQCRLSSTGPDRGELVELAAGLCAAAPLVPSHVPVRRFLGPAGLSAHCQRLLRAFVSQSRRGDRACA